jgi:triacylglycerol esterase/lipase EstA (alpha/beta hydrolase family)
LRAITGVFARRAAIAGLGLATAAVTVVFATSGTAAAATGPVQNNFVSAFLYSASHPTDSPAGANDYSCEPSEEHPNPVVLVHGTFENAYNNWAGLSPKLAEAGYCVFALNYGGPEGFVVQGTGDIPTSAARLAAFVDEVLDATGADKVDMVGHSQGGMMPRYYIKNLGGAEKVDKLIGIVSSNQGTTLFGLTALVGLFPPIGEVVDAACKACTQQIAGSDFLTELNAGGDTDPAVTYTVIATRYDEVVTPYKNSFLAPAPNVTNTKLQDVCPFNLTEHINAPYDGPTTQLVFNALDPANADEVKC